MNDTAPFEAQRIDDVVKIVQKAEKAGPAYVARAAYVSLIEECLHGGTVGIVLESFRCSTLWN